MQRSQGYMVARAVLAELMRGRPVASWRALLASRQEPFRYTTGDLFRGYVTGKRLRNRLRSDIRAICDGTTGEAVQVATTGGDPKFTA